VDWRLRIRRVDLTFGHCDKGRNRPLALKRDSFCNETWSKKRVASLTAVF
jgi:hypothetical protein